MLQRLNATVDRFLSATGSDGRIVVPAVAAIIGCWGLFALPRPGEVRGWDHAVAVGIGIVGLYLAVRVILGHREGRW